MFILLQLLRQVNLFCGIGKRGFSLPLVLFSELCYNEMINPMLAEWQMQASGIIFSDQIKKGANYGKD